MSVLPRCICDPFKAIVGDYDPRCSRHIGAPRPTLAPPSVGEHLSPCVCPQPCKWCALDSVAALPLNTTPVVNQKEGNLTDKPAAIDFDLLPVCPECQGSGGDGLSCFPCLGTGKVLGVDHAPVHSAPQSAPRSKPAAWGIEYMGELLPELYLNEQQAQTALTVRAARYGYGEHRKAVPLYRAADVKGA